MKLWLYIDFISLQLDSLFDEEQNPVAIINKNSNEVIQLNVLAKQDGLTLGMGLGTAAALSKNLHIYPYDEEAEGQQLTRIAQWLYLVTAEITIVKPNGLLLKCNSMLSLYKDLDSYWKVLSEHLNTLHVQYHFSTGYSPFSAKLLAKNAANIITDDVKHMEALLSKYPLCFTELSSKVLNNLHRIGVTQIAQLLALSLPEIAKRFDAELVTYIGRLTGQLQHLVNFYHPPEKFKHYLELLYEIVDVQRLEKPLIKVYGLLERFLQLRNKVAHEIVITFHFRDSDDFLVNVSSASGEYKAIKWLALSQLTIESVVIPSPIVAITIEAKRLVNDGTEYVDLFDGSRGDISSHELISSLQAKLGKDNVKGIQLFDDHRPEIATQFCTPLSKGEAQTALLTPSSNTCIRPAFLLPIPQPLIEEVTIHHGPERIATGWWDNKHITRDYFIARSHIGRWLWVFKTSEKQWFVHGFFS